MLSAIVVDDEPLARMRLSRLLTDKNVKVLAEADSADSALSLMLEHSPNLIFLDIKMPGDSGIHFASTIKSLPNPPLVIFVTGYSDYAATAYDLNALDYLLKPVNQERLSICIAKAIGAFRRNSRHSDLHESNTKSQVSSIAVKVDYVIKFIQIDSIDFVTTKNKNVYLHTDTSEEIRTQYRLIELEELLPKIEFYRIHESSIVKLSAIIELSYLGDHSYEVRLRNNARLRVSRSRYSDLLVRMGIPKLPSRTMDESTNFMD